MALTTNLVSYWKLDGNSNDAVASNNGTDTTITYSVANGIIVQGAGFGGSSKITMGNVLDQTGSTPFSIQVWVKTTATGINTLVSKMGGNADPNIGYLLGLKEDGVTDGTVQMSLYRGPTPNSGGIGRITTATVNNGSWHHIVGTYDGSTNDTGILIYIDGSAVSTSRIINATLTGDISNSSPFQFGARDSTAFQQYTGDLDEVGFWSRVLTSGEVTSLYNGGAGLAYPFTSGPANVKTFDGVTQSTGIKTYLGVAVASVKSVDGIT